MTHFVCRLLKIGHQRHTKFYHNTFVEEVKQELLSSDSSTQDKNQHEIFREKFRWCCKGPITVYPLAITNDIWPK